MKRKKMIILPSLNNCSGDLSKKWLVFYSVRNPKTGKMDRFKLYASLGKFHDVDSRTDAADKLIKELSEKLRSGWTPYEDASKLSELFRLSF